MEKLVRHYTIMPFPAACIFIEKIIIYPNRLILPISPRAGYVAPFTQTLHFEVLPVTKPR
jgi:hypothetical protein